MRARYCCQRGDGQVSGSYSAYGDTPMECLAEILWPRIEEVVGASLWPTYSYYRVYEKGAVLQPHLDRSACEISATACLSLELDPTQERSYVWPMWLRRNGAEPICYGTYPGDMIVYRGCEVQHWREPFLGNLQVQTFVHYVLQEGPNSSEKFDGRLGLGAPSLGGHWT